MRIVLDGIIAATVAVFAVGVWNGYAGLASARQLARPPGAASSVQAVEAALGVVPGGTRVVPQCGCTIRYLGSRQVGPRTYDVRIERLD